MTIKITKEGERFVARYPFSLETNALVKAAGFKFDWNTKTWWTKDAAIAAKFDGKDAMTVTAEINAERAKAHEAAKIAIAMSRAEDAELDVPAPEGCAYLPYQKAGIAYAMSRPSSLIGDEMGLGKTIQAIGVINADPTIKNVLVICPATPKINWQREMKKWLVRPMQVRIANGGYSFERGGVVITNYERVRNGDLAAIHKVDWDLLICDECHKLKNPNAQRTQFVFGDMRKKIEPIKARRKVFLTGTPFLNRPIELWPLVQALDPQGLGANYYSFGYKYCAGKKGRYGFDVSGASNLEELQARLRSTIMVRRLKKDVLKDLPRKQRQVIALQPETAATQAVIAREERFIKESDEQLANLRVAVELSKASDDPAVYEAAVKALRQAQGVAFAEIARVRHEVAVAKVPQVIEHLIDVLDNEDKVVVMAHHHDVIDAIMKEFGNIAVSLTGTTPMNERMANVDKFQNDPNCRMFVGSIQAAGVAITLTAASHVVFAELDWVPGNITQAEDRCHRIGQLDSVLVQHIVLDGSLDGRMAQIVVDKQNVLDAALDRATVLNEPEVLVAPKDPAATQEISAAQVAKQAGDVTDTQREAIHVGLQMLAGMCDGAVALDGAGFNKLDSMIGHSLASQQSLSPKQAALGRKLVIKYQRQLPEMVVAITKGE